MKVYEAVDSLVAYGIKNGLIDEKDAVYSRNLILDVIGSDDYESAGAVDGAELEDILKCLLDYAVENGRCVDSVTYRDLLDTKIMNCLMPRPSEVIAKFNEDYAVDPRKATEYYYSLAKNSDYIRTYRVKKDMKWVTHTEYGDMDVTVNLSKPEKDPKAIAEAAKAKSASYPKCMLCRENEGYAGRVNHPARENHRIIPLDICGEKWFMQYSPYVYYNEHCIVFNGEHTPMKIDKSAFLKLFAFVKFLPHYFVGSNADLPIVGGSILSHEHFQGGNYEFAMAKAGVERELKFDGFDDVAAGVVKWPMTVIRLSGDDTDRICELGAKILAGWRGYTDPDAFIFAETDGTPHNTITPIARKRGDKYELDLVLRNNITTAQYPDGVYHPHPEYHHIKKENIGLIEVMGLAVLPARLKNEMALLKDALIAGKDFSADETIGKHYEWASAFENKYGRITEENAEDIIKNEIGIVYSAILEQCGVFSRDEKGAAHMDAFVKYVNDNKI